MKYQAPNTCADEGNNGPEPVRAAFETEREYPFMKEVLNVGVIGLGNRGSNLLENCILPQPGVRVLAVCDNYEDRREKGVQLVTAAGQPAPRAAADYREVLAMPEIDAVVIMASWESHLNLACDAMRAGKYTAVEVAGAYSVEDCWKLVRTHEETGVPCMMLENCCYDFFEMATLNMAQQGLFGEVMHVEGAYIHDLRSLNLDDKTGYYDMWRLKYNTDHTGNPYPTHGLGPVCQILNIHRGDKMNYLVSVSTDQKGLSLAAAGKFGKDSEYAETDYKLGDMNTTLIRTAKGKTILIQHDVTSPRPYDRLHKISGTKGFAQKYPVEGIALEPNAHSFLAKPEFDQLMAEYEHPISKEIGEKARQVGGHGGMDFIMDYRLIYCLHNGLPLDQDVYDAAEWSSLVELTETSVKHRGMPVKVPDFTRGAWNRINGFSHAVK